MQSELSNPHIDTKGDSQQRHLQNSITNVEDENNDLHLATPSSEVNSRPGKRSPLLRARGTNGKVRGKARRIRPEGGDHSQCHLLQLPEDVLEVLLGRLPPRSLSVLSATCRLLRQDLTNEGIWKNSYINHFLWDGAARNVHFREEVKVLVQGCSGIGGRGWRKEALDREMTLERWINSKTAMVIHHPSVGLIRSLSLSYPSYVPSAPAPLVVGKTHSTQPPTPSTADTSATINEEDTNDSPHTPGKLTHRQKYEALLAATTRPAPYVLSAGMVAGAIVRSDPISGKVSKGYWGPGRDANFHIRPQFDNISSPTAIHLPSRNQTHALWGLSDGSTNHTTMLSRHHATQGGRASSLNVSSRASDSHEGAVTSIWSDDECKIWITGGMDGRVKVWQLHASSLPRSGKRSPAAVAGLETGYIECLFFSEIVAGSFNNRSDNVKRRQNGSPDAITLVRYDAARDVAAGITNDGDLRVWFDATKASEPAIRIDIGSEEEYGAVTKLELDVTGHGEGIVAAVMILREGREDFASYHVVPVPEEPVRQVITYTAPVINAISTLQAHFTPTMPISRPSASHRIDPDVFDISTNELSTSTSPPPLDLSPPSSDPPVKAHSADSEAYGRFVVAGDREGLAYIWPWNAKPTGDDQVLPIRAWAAMSARITSIDVSCGLVAIGSADGYIKIFDPLPSPPILLRSFHANHLSPADSLVALSNHPDSAYYTVNQIILENDLIVASIGRKIFAWRAGSGGRKKGQKGSKGRVSGGRDVKGPSRNLDMKAVHHEADESHLEIRERNNVQRVTSGVERMHMAAMEDLGLDNGDEALEYALLLSMEDGGVPGERSVSVEELSEGVNRIDEDEDEAVRAVEAFRRAEEEETREMLEMIRRAEEREASLGSHS